jgi:regulator of sigma E protease
MTWLVVIVGLLFLVLIHEAGHFYTAIAVGIRPRKFYVGFPPAIAKFKRNGIEYALGAIPLGGYVRIPGMHRAASRDARMHFSLAVNEDSTLAAPLDRLITHLDAEDDPAARATLPELEHAVENAELSGAARRGANRGLRELDEALGDDAYWRQRTWKRVAVIFAGPGVNILFAIALLATVYAIGVPRALPTVAQVLPKSPAASAGLKQGDKIVSIDGKPTPTFDEVHNLIADSNGKPIVVTVSRNGHLVTLKPAATEKTADGRIFGFRRGDAIRNISYPIGTSVRYAVQDTWQAVVGTGQAIGGLFHKKERGQLTSTVGIVRESHRALEVSFRLYLQIVAYISLALALLNLLPLLPLDGGHILFSIIEGVRRRAVAREVYERASVIGFALILLIFFIALNNDLGSRGGG